MKTHKTNQGPTKKSIKKKKRKEKRKEKRKKKRATLHISSQQNVTASLNNTDSTSFKGMNELIIEPELFLPHFNKESSFNDTVALTPSKSESDTIMLCDTVENSHEESFTLTEESEMLDALVEDTVEETFNNASTMNVSYTYSNVMKEFVVEEVSEKDCAIVSSPVIKQNVEEVPPISAKPKKVKKKKLKVKNLECFEKTESVSSLDDSTMNSETPDKGVQYHETDDGIIIVLDNNESIYFHGLMLLTVLHGEIEILGYTLTKDSQEAKVYSPRGTALLYLKNVTTSYVPLQNYLTNLKELKLTDHCAIILCKKLEENNISFIEKHVSQQILPNTINPNLPRVIFQPKGSWNVIKTSTEWDKIINKIGKTTKLMICGGKGVGKTTLLRYAINKLLMKFQQVRVIDLDPGQSEFTIPGCISIVTINKSVFGTNYTHLQTAERSILSNINIGYEPKKYVASVKCLLNIFLEEMPTLVNYMGYTHGIGINILAGAIVHVQPTDVLQIVSRDSKNNFECRLTPNAVKKNGDLFTDFVPDDLNYQLHGVESMCDENDGWTAQPRQLREMSILSYLSQMTDSNSIFTTKSPMYKIDMSEISITDLNGKTIHPAAINAHLVALCSVAEEATNIFECLGFGIVRGVDTGSNTLVLLTLEKLEMLEKVSHIILHSATLPPSIYMTPDEITGQIPYVIEGVLMSFGQIPKRSKISVKNKV